MGEWNSKANELCLKALALPERSAQAALLDQECAGDAELRAAVETLLKAHAQAGLLERPQAAEATGAYTPADSDVQPANSPYEPAIRPGLVIAGKYKLLHVIGEGGMGSVWRAEQIEPVKRFVAVKLIKAGMDSRQVLARFEAERQALALMDHPNIAKVLDGGLHDHRPFFVMELVKGVPITEYCDQRKLTPRQRLELFVPVCQAIQHAHQKGIIHRDIKPSNVLVALYDDRPVVKVIDFGVAKATGGKLTEATIDTGQGGVVGTPLYMSPEQATLNNLDIDTRSDVYALGVLLYELLTGSPPFSRKELEKKGFLEMLRVVREEEPPRPSTKLSTADALPSISANRGTEPKTLTSLLRNDLDWIVMKALEKDRARRYETANGFAADVLRYLSGEAVLAHPPSTAYRVKKFVRRHRGQVIAASLVFCALVAGIAGTTLALFEAKRQESAALAAEASATKRLRTVEKANVIMASIFENLDPKEIAKAQRPLQAILVDKIDKAIDLLELESIGDELVVAEMQNRLGLSLLGLGKPEKAIIVFERCRKIHAVKLGPDHQRTLASMANLAFAYEFAGRVADALPLHEETVKAFKAKFGPDHPDTLTSMNNLAMGYESVGRLADALRLYEETLKARKAKLGPEHPHTLTTMSNLASTYETAGRVAEALPLYEEALKLLKAKVGPDHPDTLSTMNNLALGYQSAGRLADALPLFEETLRARKATLGPEHPNTLTSMANLASGYKAAGRLAEALPLYEETVKLMKAKLGPEHPRTLILTKNLARAYESAGRLADALPLFESAAGGMEKMKFRHEYAQRILPTTIDAYVAAEKFDLADAWRRKWLAFLKGDGQGETPAYAGELAAWGTNLMERKKFTEAESVLRECLTIREKSEPDKWSTFGTQSQLGGALLGQKKYADAEPLLQKGYEGMKAREKTIPLNRPTRIPEALDRLIELYTATNQPNEVKIWQAERGKYPAAKVPPAK